MEQATIKLNFRSVFNFLSFRVAGGGVEDGATNCRLTVRKTQRWMVMILIVALTLPQLRDQLEFY
jgi:hypothetical protein